MTTVRRVQRDGDFGKRFLVVCPKCKGCAEVSAARHLARAARLVCPECGRSDEAELFSWRDSDPEDWYFHRPLWLRTPCKSGILWAHNFTHLTLIESYVSADLRARRDPQWVGSRVSRLPRWMILRKNRDEVLRAIGRLRGLDSSGKRTAVSRRKPRIPAVAKRPSRASR